MSSQGSTEERDGARSRDARVRGSIVAARLAFVTRRLVLARLAPAERARATGIAVDGDWFAFSTLDLLDRTIVRDLADGDATILRDLGRESACRNLARIRAARGDGTDIASTLERLGRTNLFQDFGDGVFDALEGGATLTYRYPFEVPETYCRSAVGFFEGLLDALGCQDVRVTELECQSLGAAAHRYELRWAPPPGGIMASVAAVDDPTESTHGPSALTARGPRVEQHGRRARSIPPEGGTRPRGFATNPARRGPPSVGRATCLVIALGALALVAVWQWIAADREHDLAVAGPPMRFYDEVGDAGIVLSYDDPYIRFVSTRPLAPCTMTIHEAGHAYTIVLPLVPGNSYLETEISDFTASDGTHPDPKHPPSYVTVHAHSEGRQHLSEYRLK
jgi:hypothetical protein